MTRSRALAALALTLAVLWGAAIAGAQTTTVPPTTAVGTATTAVSVSDSMPVSDSGGLPNTGANDPAGLGLFGFVMVGIGLITLVGSRRLLTTEDHRR